MVSVREVVKVEPEPGRRQVAHMPHITARSHIVVAEPQHASAKVHGFNGQASHQAPHCQGHGGSGWVSQPD